MTEYERGRRDAIRDVILYLLKEREAYYESEPEHGFITSRCRRIENLTGVKPDGEGTDWSQFEITSQPNDSRPTDGAKGEG